jgi:hypothetical protein
LCISFNFIVNKVVNITASNSLIKRVHLKRDPKGDWKPKPWHDSYNDKKINSL